MKKSEPISKHLRKLSREELSKIKAGDGVQPSLKAPLHCVNASKCSTGCAMVDDDLRQGGCSTCCIA